MPLNRPGILVEVSSLVAAPPQPPSPGTLFLVGYAPWGPINTPVYVGSLQAARTIFGEPANPETGMWVPRTLKHFFAQSAGTGRAYVVRGFEFGATVTDEEAARAKATLNTAAPASPALTVKAAWAGALGNGFKVDVIAAGPTGKRVILWGRYRREILDWEGDQAKMAKKVADWNALADAYGSDFRLELPATFQAAGPDPTASASASELFAPSATAVPLTGGSDGETASFPLSKLYGLDAQNRPQGLDVLGDKRYGPGHVAIPGYVPTATLVNTLDAHCRQYARTALVSLLASGVQTAQQAVTAKAALPASSHVAYYYPRVRDDEGLLCPAEGYVAGLAAARMARNDEEGGVKASLTGPVAVTGVETIAGFDPVGDAEAELLYLNRVNYFRFERGTGYRLESQLLGTGEGAITRVHHRNLANYFQYLLEDALVPFRDRNIDGSGFLQDAIATAIQMALEPYGPGKVAPNGDSLYAAAVVVADDSIQNEADINQGLLHVYVEVQFSPKAERVVLSFNVVPVRLA